MNPEYWKKDIDLTAMIDNKIYEVEIKWDKKINKSGAMFLELLTDIEQNKQGWANYTQADFIFYGDAINRLFYVFSVSDMREYLKTHIGEYRTLTAKDINQYTGQVTKLSLGAIVPIESF